MFESKRKQVTTCCKTRREQNFARKSKFHLPERNNNEVFEPIFNPIIDKTLNRLVQVKPDLKEISSN